MVVPRLVKRVGITVGRRWWGEVGWHDHRLVKAVEELVGTARECLQLKAFMACSREVSQMLEGVEYDGIGATGSVGGWPGG